MLIGALFESHFRGSLVSTLLLPVPFVQSTCQEMRELCDLIPLKGVVYPKAEAGISYVVQVDLDSLPNCHGLDLSVQVFCTGSIGLHEPNLFLREIETS